ncbi:hypothetical protein [Bibersteinia trehalosi]|uniref:hypothetical protein n=1 Tax=Bibersteinia trehalosi TaxID=47735 RepID=UPI004046695D
MKKFNVSYVILCYDRGIISEDFLEDVIAENAQKARLAAIRKLSTVYPKTNPQIVDVIEIVE